MKNIIKDNIDSVLKSRYLSYAVSTIISRSLPDVRDGLKPVHRRIIYSMYLLKLFNNTQFKKSARSPPLCIHCLITVFYLLLFELKTYFN